MAVYVDVLLALNFAVDFLILKAAAAFCGMQPRTLRLVMGAAAGALGALIIFFPLEGRLALFLYRAAVSAAVCAAAFCPCRIGRFVRAVFAAFSLSFFFSGIMLLWRLTAAPEGVISHGGAFYLDIGAPALIACSAAGYLCACLLSRLLAGRLPEERFCEVTVVNNGATASFRALIDTGSSLVEPFSGLPVIVCELAALGPAAPDGIARFREGKAAEGKLRLIPYKTIDSSGLLPAFMPEALLIKREDKGRSCRGRCYVAAINGVLGEGYRAICHPQAFLHENEAGDAVYEDSI